MKNRKLILILSLVLALTMSLGGTLAYLTDTDSEVNVMTIGNVIIDLIEQQRNGVGALEDFEQRQTMVPIVGSAQAAADGSNMDKFGMTTAANYVDKIISVKNTGVSDAWVRVLVAVPASLEKTGDAAGPLHWNLGNRVDLEGNYVHANYNSANWHWDYTTTNAEVIKIDDADYNVYCFYFKDQLAKGVQTSAAVAGFYFDSDVDYDADNGYYTFKGNKIDNFNGSVVIPVLAQAVQASGFGTYTAAFEAAFPYMKDGVNQLQKWFDEDMTMPTSVDDATEMKDALVAGGEVILTKDVEATEPVNVTGGTLNGNGQTITVNNLDTTVNNPGIKPTAGTISNVTVKGEAVYNPSKNKTYGFRALYIDKMTDNVYVDNCVLEGTYPININLTSSEYGLYVTDSTLNGWTSYAAIKEAKFTNCTFGEAEGYARLRPYANTTLTNCTFSQNFIIDLSMLGDGKTVTLENCKVGGVVLTAENYASYIKVEPDTTKLLFK